VLQRIRIGCAGWALPKSQHAAFPPDGTHLQRYAARFSAVEINSSFYRPHRPATYARWGTSVPVSFRFAVKIPKAITHERRLVDADGPLEIFLAQVDGLGLRLGCLLVQLPPSLAYDVSTARAFFTALRARHAGAVVLEPRHASWFAPVANRLLEKYRIARVAADPGPLADKPGGWPETIYFRLHGSPRMYYSAYSEPYLDALAIRLKAAAGRAAVWCIFDNTGLGAATANALGLLARLE
jgi:uncharacterized protein YecE (DUF72 family)